MPAEMEKRSVAKEGCVGGEVERIRRHITSMGGERCVGGIWILQNFPTAAVRSVAFAADFHSVRLLNGIEPSR